MVTKISPADFSLNEEPWSRNRSLAGTSVSRIRWAVEMAQAPQGEKVPLHGQPPARTHVTRQIMITALRCAVVSGTYNVKAEHIIDKMFAAILVDMLV